jgi:hypothetical protein
MVIFHSYASLQNVNVQLQCLIAKWQGIIKHQPFWGAKKHMSLGRLPWGTQTNMKLPRCETHPLEASEKPDDLRVAYAYSLGTSSSSK